MSKKEKLNSQKQEILFNRDILGTVDYVAESIALLYHLGSGQTFEEIRIDLEKKYVMKFQMNLYKFELLERIEKRAHESFLTEQDELSYYFSCKDNEKGSCVGKFVLLWDEWGGKSFQNVAEYKKYLDKMPEKEYCEKFGNVVQSCGDAVRDETTYDVFYSPMEIISYIMKMDAPEADKWKIQAVFIDRSLHQGKVLKLVEKGIEILKEFSSELEHIGETFKQYWVNQLEHSTLRQYVSTRLSLQMEENPYGFILRPTFINLNTMGIHTETKEDGTYMEADAGVLGIIFGDEFPLRINIENTDEAFHNYVGSVLKLLSDKSKFEILSFIKDKPAYGSELAKMLNLTTATISHHMTGLVASGLVEMTNEKNRIYYQTNKKALKEVLDYCTDILTKDE